MKDFLTEIEQQGILQAVAAAEKQTSGEIRLFIEEHCKAEVLDRAAFIFAELGMHKTALRNGVLFYFAVKDHKFAILGDAGINAKTGESFWDKIKLVMQEHFRKEEFAEGLRIGIGMAGEALKTHFPYKGDDKNELPDEIAFGK